MTNTQARPLHAIADEIVHDWRNMYFGAVPYVQAMRRMASVTDAYGMDDGKSIVLYFLSNAKTWRGETAKRVKTELKAMVK